MKVTGIAQGLRSIINERKKQRRDCRRKLRKASLKGGRLSDLHHGTTPM